MEHISEAYLDDVLVHPKSGKELIANPEEVSEITRFVSFFILGFPRWIFPFYFLTMFCRVYRFRNSFIFLFYSFFL